MHSVTIDLTSDCFILNTSLGRALIEFLLIMLSVCSSSLRPEEKTSMEPISLRLISYLLKFKGVTLTEVLLPIFKEGTCFLIVTLCEFKVVE